MMSRGTKKPELGAGPSDDGRAGRRPDRTVGVLLVHGMGEQKRGEHAERVVRSFLRSWGRPRGVGGKPRYQLRETLPRASCSCPDPGDAPCTCAASARISVRVALEQEIVEVRFHEVWWADLGQRKGMANWLRFLGWVASMPFRRQKKTLGTGRELERAEGAGLRIADSRRTGWRGVVQFFVLLFASTSALITVFAWGAVRRLLRPFALSPVVLLQSFGDVQAYQEEGRPETGDGVDMALPPRFAIRRRMIEEMVAMAERGFDEWYVMAHPVNVTEAFPDRFRWINVYSPMDPFSGSLVAYARLARDQGITALEPESHVYTGCGLAFVAHAKYLRGGGREEDLCIALGRWWLDGQPFRLRAEGRFAILWDRASVALQSVVAAGGQLWVLVRLVKTVVCGV